MSDLLQSRKYPDGQHPDADQLNAFVEHALPEHERLATLAHLAECTNCREVVALSLPPLEDLSRAEPAPLLKPWFAGWFAGWRLVWIAAPALAGLVILTIYLKNPQPGKDKSSSSTQMAAAHQPSPPPPPPLSSEPSTSKASLGLRTAPPRHDSNTAKPTPEVEASIAPAPPANGRGVAALKLNAQPATGQSRARQSSDGPVLAHGTMSGMASGAGASPAPKPSGATEGFLQQPPRAAAATAPTVSQAATVQLPPPTPSSPASPAAPASVSSADSAVVTVTVQNSVLPVSGMEAPRPTAGFALRTSGLVTAQAPLPSGLAILSLAANLNQRLAIDTRNQLFFSEDDGQHWKAVTPLWKGRAITVATLSHAPLHSRGLALAVPERFTAGALASTTQPGDLGSSLSGTVTDSTGAVIPNATVVATDSRTTLVRTVQTDANGRYLVKELPPGVYRIEANAPGFLKQSQTAALPPSQQAVTNVVLAVGQVSQTVTVEASSAQLDTLSRTMPDSLAKVKKLKASPAATKPTPLFAVTTDTGDRWTSADGQTWKHE